MRTDSVKKELSHAYIITSPSREKREGAALSLAAEMLCSAVGQRPCRLCRDCRKVFAGIHPDIIFIDRGLNKEGRESREILITQVRSMVAESAVRPNEAEKKVFIIRGAEDMNVRAQNALLKLLEEPPRHVAFILCTENPALLLPTVRSRCAELRTEGVRTPLNGEPEKRAKDFFSAIASADRGRLLKLCTEYGKLDPSSALETISAGGALAAEMLCLRENDMGLTRESLMRVHELLSRAESCLLSNVSAKSVFGLLSVSAMNR